MIQRRKAPRTGIQRAPARTWRRHEQWVRGFACVAIRADGDNCHGKIQLCHFREAANSGTGLKPAAWFTFPGCEGHHEEQHRIGQPAFERKHKLSLRAECLRLARFSPDLDMRAAAREAGAI